MCRIRVLRIRESGFLANFDSWRPTTPGLLYKRPKKDPKNRFTGPDFENNESNRGSWVLILRIRYSSSKNKQQSDARTRELAHGNSHRCIMRAALGISGEELAPISRNLIDKMSESRINHDQSPKRCTKQGVMSCTLPIHTPT